MRGPGPTREGTCVRPGESRRRIRAQISLLPRERAPKTLVFGENHSLFIQTMTLCKQKSFQKTKTNKNSAMTPEGKRRKVRRERWTQRMALAVLSFPCHTLPGTSGKRLFHKRNDNGLGTKLTLKEKRGTFFLGIQNSEDRRQC